MCLLQSASFMVASLMSGTVRTMRADGKCGMVVQKRAIRSERHFGATMNYVHHNPVHHGYCRQWQDWPFSSASAFLQSVGKEEAARIWNAYPILEYGKGWDDPEM